jgi:hypothetical protein
MAVVATRIVSSSGTYSTTYSWTPATETNGCIAAYQITSVSVLQVSVTDTVTVAESVTALFPTLFCSASDAMVIAESVLASPGSGNNMKTLLITGPQADINGTLKTILYTSDSGYTGADTLTMMSTNATNNVDTDVVNITVIAVPAGAPEEVETLAEAPAHRRHFAQTKKAQP